MQAAYKNLVTVFDSSMVPQPFLDSDVLEKIRRREQCTVRGEKPR